MKGMGTVSQGGQVTWGVSEAQWNKMAHTARKLKGSSCWQGCIPLS